MDIESGLAVGDGFFLNLVTVMHQLSLKIKLHQVDAFYPFHPKGRLTEGVAELTKVGVSSQEHSDWVERLKKSPHHVWQVLISIYCYGY